MQIDMDQFRNSFFTVFFDEAAEHLANMEAGLLRLESAPDDQELLHGIFRGAHSIKGASGMFGFADVTRFTHAMENLLDCMRDGKIATPPPLTDLLLRSTDILRTLVAVAKEGGEPPAALESTLVELQQALRQKSTGVTVTVAPQPARTPDAAEGAERAYRIIFKPGRDIFRQGMEPFLLLRELAALGELLDAHADLSQLPALADLDPESCYLGWSLILKTDKSVADIKEVFAFVEDCSEITIEEAGDWSPETSKEAAKSWGLETSAFSQTPDPKLQAPSVLTQGSALRAQHSDSQAPSPKPQTPDPKPQAPNVESASIRVATEKVDKLINLVGELVITQSMISQTLQHFCPDKINQLQESVAELERNTRELQERVMAVRMLPIGTSFNRFPRLARDLAAKLGKKIAVQMIGEDTELDKGVIERIGDPLTHLVRNAADHGLESPDERRAAGKSEQGVIRLQAYHQGGNVMIEVADDGRGLNTERIKQKALSQGLINPDDVLGDEQIHALIFHPGFSTAAAVSDVSGRGVGMDVVKKNIEALNGSVAIMSEPGRGSCFRIKLPLTLAIIDGLTLGVGEQIYILPLTVIVESIQPRQGQVRRVMGQGEVVMVRGEFLPLLRLHDLFDIPAWVTEPTRGLVVIVENEGKRFGLLVDELLGQSQVVIKNLETNYRKVEGVIGATIMGDGRVALILDVSGLTRLATLGGGWAPAAAPPGEGARDVELAAQQMDAEMVEA